MALMKEEQETHINFNRDDERAMIHTSDTTMITKLNKLVGISGAEWRKEREERLQRTGELVGVTYSCPVSFISFRSKRIARSYTDEQKAEIGKRLHEKR
ncbi:MAG: hypothetical protein Q4C58_15515 [Eubacteriales bacterium]|nr:hypothetical protein [Eubacteriales bacterium]